MAPAMDIDVKTEKKKKKEKHKDLLEADKLMDCAGDSFRKAKKKKNNKNDDSALVQLIAKYLEKRNLHKSLSSLLSETQCKSSWKTQTMDLEDIFNQYSIQDSENLKKHNAEEGIVEQKNNCMSINVQNDNDESEPAKSKGKKRKVPIEDIDQYSEKKPRKIDSVKLEKYFQEPVEVTKKVKNKKKKDTECKDLIDYNEHKTSSHKEDRSSMEDNNSQESPEVFKDKHKKKKNSMDNDLIIDDKRDTYATIGNVNSIKEKNKSSKTYRKNKEAGKLDESFQEALDVPKKEDKKKKNFKDRDLESQEVPKQKRKEEQVAKVEDSGDETNQNGSRKNQKDGKGCKKKLISPSSNAISEAAINNNLNGLVEDTDKPLFDTPGQKGVNGDIREGDISLNSKQKSGEATTAKAFQRVKVEEVEFVDPRLQDNSYWAKSGAEIGYGAKAEHVLGQVRGKDFRHEKTKKKRGSYKGGMIDLQSHSIKFSYSDEE